MTRVYAYVYICINCLHRTISRAVRNIEWRRCSGHWTVEPQKYQGLDKAAHLKSKGNSEVELLMLLQLLRSS